MLEGCGAPKAQIMKNKLNIQMKPNGIMHGLICTRRACFCNCNIPLYFTIIVVQERDRDGYHFFFLNVSTEKRGNPSPTIGT